MMRFGVLQQCGRLIRTTLFHVFRRSDHEKWEKYDFPTEWALRLERVSEMIPNGSYVFEFGAGPVGLRSFLHPSCTLTSSDLVPRGPGMMVVDLNSRPLPTLAGIQTDIAVLAGVLEYVSDVPSLIEWLAKKFTTCIVTYESAQPTRGLGRVREVVGRAHSGWVNHFSEREFIDLFTHSGFALQERSTWGLEDPESVFVFRNIGSK